ncbi:hypothetical protein H5410_036646 [Solanum commersonii]|uniref:Endonuclease/exonuclease/phosphatase n=1 Tax=Solanum commersonii TaxID=4109 RepID=A0A9J5Y8T4_SOLCO|nr:hypothetical protein H5410_036646 [Solanum commersonii]
MKQETFKGTLAFQIVRCTSGFKNLSNTQVGRVLFANETGPISSENKSPISIKENSNEKHKWAGEEHVSLFKDLSNLKLKAYDFLTTFSDWENKVQQLDTSSTPEEIRMGISNMQTEAGLINPTDNRRRACEYSITQEVVETEASNRVNSHILKLSNTYGVAFVGFEKETLALLMRIDERKAALDKKRPREDDYNPKKWMKCGYMEAEGSKGGILIMWDSRNWRGTQVEMGQHSIIYEFVSTQNSFTWYLTGVYAPDSREEKLACSEEISAVKELCGGPWVACGDFNTIRSMGKEEGAIESLM